LNRILEVEDWEETFQKCEVIWKYPGRGPHAAYTLSNRHSDFYFNSDYLISQPGLLKEACVALFNIFKAGNQPNPAWLVTYPPYGMNIAFCLAELMQSRLSYITSLDAPQLNFEITPEQSILFCADDLYTGGSYERVRLAVEEKGALIGAPLLVLANFSGSSSFRGHEVLALIEKKINLWTEAECPLCKAESTALPARKNWSALLAAGR
jgi:hypothetical protein